MADLGPRIEAIRDGDWIKHLAAERVTSWYHNPRLYAWLRRRRLQLLKPLLDFFAPRAYACPDKDGIPDADDLVRCKQSTYDAAVRAAQRIARGLLPVDRFDLDAFITVWHERLHCKVPWQGTVPEATYREAAEIYGHPTGAIPGFLHARRRQYAVNSFTGLLRRRLEPEGTLLETATWILMRHAQRELS
jgi:hypothetical protein